MPKSVFITGAKVGIGLEFVRQFAISDNPPKYIFASGRNLTEAKNLHTLADKYSNVHLVELDVTNDQQIEAAVKKVAALVGDDGLNLLINNAGISEDVKFPRISREYIIMSFNVNAASPLMLTQAFLHLLRKAASKQSTTEMSISKAAVINLTAETASIHFDSRYDPNSIGMYSYDSAKAALNLLTKHVAFNLKSDGILLAAISPGWVDTPAAQRLLENVDQGEVDREMWGVAEKPEDALPGIIATLRRLTDKHTGGYFRHTGEKIEDYDFASATKE